MGVWQSIGVRLAALGLLLSGCSSLGDRCGSNADCSGNLVCVKFQVDGGLSEFGVCSHPAGDLDSFCRASADCGDGLICSNELPSATKRLDGLCLPFREEGESCASSASCRVPLECLLTAAENGVCGAPPGSDAAVPSDGDPETDARADAPGEAGADAPGV